jgi:hypothetical protein
MGTPTNWSYCYVHSEAITTTFSHTESDGTQLVFDCPECQGKASFNPTKRVGHCFVCGRTIKLHTCYDRTPITELLVGITYTLAPERTSHDIVTVRTEIITRPLSQSAWAYIDARGIDPAVVERFGLLEETTYRDMLYLAWPTSPGNYELRAASPIQTHRVKMTPKGHQKSFSLVRLTPQATICVIGEGLFSVLSYAQLTQRLDAWYVILNSASNAAKLGRSLEMLTTAGITEVILALDQDEAGRQATTALAQVCAHAGLHVTEDLPPQEGDDWNDVLRRGQAVSAPEAHRPVTVEVLPSKTVPDASSRPPTGPVRLDVHYYQEILAQHGRVVVAAPCGAGKTTTAADLIAQTWREGVLYVAERVEQLRTIRELLLQRDVPSEVIGLYAAGSADQQALRQESIQKPIALLTHVRMQMYAPQAYVLFPSRGGHGHAPPDDRGRVHYPAAHSLSAQALHSSFLE